MMQDTKKGDWGHASLI